MVVYSAELSATTVSLNTAIFISEYANVITDPPFTVCLIELLPYYIMVSNTTATSAQSSGFALVMHSYYQCQHTVDICTLAATNYGNNSTVATDAGNAYSTWIPLQVQEYIGTKQLYYKNT
jgi:hypothetical protein